MTPRLLPRELAAAYLSVSPRTLDQLAIPARRFPGARGIRYDIRDLDAFADDLPYARELEGGSPPCAADQAFG